MVEGVESGGGTVDQESVFNESDISVDDVEVGGGESPATSLDPQNVSICMKQKMAVWQGTPVSVMLVNALCTVLYNHG